jgi:hypothetical protein
MIRMAHLLKSDLLLPKIIRLVEVVSTLNTFCQDGVLLVWRGADSKEKTSRLWFPENKEKELEKQRDEIFNLYGPMVPQGKE